MEEEKDEAAQSGLYMQVPALAFGVGSYYYSTTRVPSLGFENAKPMPRRSYRHLTICPTLSLSVPLPGPVPHTLAACSNAGKLFTN
jgi:hypothetical protein